MRTFAQKPKAPRQITSTKWTITGREHPVQGGVVNSMLHDFSRISVYPQAPLKPQTKLTVNTPGDIDEQEADRVAEDGIRAPGPQLLQPCTRSSAHARVQINQPAREHDAPETMRVRAGQVTAPPLVHEGLQST